MDFKEQAANAIKWIDALLSGKYKQAKFQLGDPKSGFCCWGLGCHLMKINFNPHNGWNENFGGVIGWKDGVSGVTEAQGNIVGLLHDNNLSTVNDVRDKTFPQIGHALKTYPEEAFRPEVAALIREHYSSVGELSAPAE